LNLDGTNSGGKIIFQTESTLKIAEQRRHEWNKDFHRHVQNPTSSISLSCTLSPGNSGGTNKRKAWEPTKQEHS